MSAPEWLARVLPLKARRTVAVEPMIFSTSMSSESSVIELETRKWHCRECGRTFSQRFPGIQPRMRATEAVPVGGVPEAF